MLCSFPRSGRSWLRFMLACYLDEHLGLGVGVDFHTIFQLIPNRGGDPQRGAPAYRFRERADVPFVIADHSPFGPAIAGAPVILMIRSPLDTLVSAYFYHTRRTQRFTGTLPEFLRDRELGAPALVDYMNGWEERLARPELLALSYEQLHADTTGTLARVLEFLEVEVNAAAVARAVDAAGFENMRAMELRSGPLDEAIRPEPGAPQALRARAGEVGGYRGHLTPEDTQAVIDYCSQKLGARVKALFAEMVVMGTSVKR